MKKDKQVTNTSELFDDSVSLFTKEIDPKTKTGEYLKSSVSWVNGCVNAISDMVAMANIRLYRYKNDGKAEEIVNHPALDVLYRANDFMTKFDLMWLTSQYLELTGEAPWFVSYKGSRPDQLILLRPDQLTLIKGEGEAIISGYKYKIGVKEIKLEPYEVVFLRYPDPENPFRGRGALQAVARTFDIDEYSEIWNEKFFSNSARPDMMLTTDSKLGDEQVIQLEKKINKKFKGVDNAHKTVVLQNGLKMAPMQLSPKDMEFIEQQRFGRDKIMAIFRVPKSILGITEDVNRANAEAGDYIFASRTIKPKLERIIEQLNEFFLPLFTNSENLYFDFDDPVPENTLEKMNEIANGLQNGWLTLNEARSMRGLPGIGEEGDKNRIASNLVPAGESILGPITNGFNQRGVALQVRKNRKGISEKDVKELIKRQIKKQVKKSIIEQIKTTSHNEPTIDPEEIPWLKFQEKQLAVGDSFVPLYKAKIIRIFAKQRKEILSKFPEKALKTKKKDIDKYKLDPDEQKIEFEKSLNKLTGTIIVDQSAEAYGFIGIDGALTRGNPLVEDFLKTRIFKLAGETTEVTNRLLGEALAEGIRDGEGIPQLKKRVNSVFSDMAKYRSEAIARTEVIKASNWASDTSYKESGVVVSKRWLTALDDRTCEYCGPLNGTIVELGDSYFDKGDTYRGKDGGTLSLDYETIETPPLHVNCRCTIIPVIQRSIASPKDVKEEKTELEQKVDKILDEELDA